MTTRAGAHTRVPAHDTSGATMATIHSPVSDFEGVVAGVEFASGVGETSDPAALGYFRRHGYGINGPPPVPPADQRRLADDLVSVLRRFDRLSEPERDRIEAYVTASLRNVAPVGTPLRDAAEPTTLSEPEPEPIESEPVEPATGTGESDESRPSTKAKKAEWEAYATARGIDVDGLNKNQIIEAVDAQEA